MSAGHGPIDRRTGPVLVIAILLTMTAALAIGVRGTAAPPACVSLNQGDVLARSPIHHVFFLIKENHAFENYFGDRPGVLGYPPTGSFPVAFGSNQTIAPFPLNGSGTPGLPHTREAEVVDGNGGKLDNFVAEATALGAEAPQDAVGYYPPKTIAPYVEYADRYALADRFFTGVLGPTLPNRVFDLAGNNGNWTSGNPPPPGTFDFPTVLGQLSAHGIPWAYDYAGVPVNLAPILVPSIGQNPCAMARVVPVTGLPAQLNSTNPPSVTFLDPANDPTISEHPNDNVTLGAEWSATVFDDIFRSPIGPSSAIFLFYDEAGGYWDPVTPPTIGATGDGFRVPFLVLSPWTPSGVILDQPLDPAALLKFVDQNWGLPYLNTRVAAAPPLTGFFNFGGQRTPPLYVPSNVSLGAGTGAPYTDADTPAGLPPTLPTQGPAPGGSTSAWIATAWRGLRSPEQSDG